MTRVRILHVVGQLGAGGTERQLLHLLAGLDRSRYEPRLATFTPGGALEADFRAICPVHLLPKSLAREPRVMAGLASLARRHGADVLHASLFPANWRGALAAMIARTPVFVASVRNMGEWMGPLRRAVERGVARRADAVVVNAAAVGRYLVESVGAPPERIRVVPNGVDPGVFHPGGPEAQRIREGFGLAGGGFVAGAVMSLTVKKNPDVLLDAAADVLAARPEIRIVLAGDGPLRPDLERRIDALGLRGRVALLGLRRDVPEVLRALDLLVLPSSREGLPNVVLEAMATGLPVVATAVGGTPELIEDGRTGRLVPPGDRAALAAAILDVASDPGRARTMGAAAMRRAREGFSIEAMIGATSALYDELLGRARARRGAAAAAERPAATR